MRFMSVLSLGLLLLSGSGWSQSLLVGASKKKITPDKTVFLAGYASNRPNNGGVHDDIWVRTLVIKSGNEMFALAVCDLIGVMRFDVMAIRDMVKSVPKERLTVAATHVHSGPDTIGLWGPSPGVTGRDEAYVSFVRKTVAESVEEAAQNLKPAVVAFGSTKVEGVSYNFRVKEILDTESVTLQFKDKESDKVIATLVNFACHPEVLNNDQLTADFAHWLCDTVEEKAGGIAIYANGALGGMISPDETGKENAPKGRDWARAEAFGKKIANLSLESLKGAKYVDNLPLQHAWQEVTVPMENEGFKLALKAGVIPGGDLLKEDSVATEVHAIRFGPAIFLTMPGEVLPNLGFLLKRMLHDKGEYKLLIGLGNDELGYILCEEDHWLDLYRYERSMSVGSQIGEALISSARQLTKGWGPAPKNAGGATEAELQKYITRFRPERAGNFKGVYRLELSGEGGGVWHLKIADGKATLENEGDPKASDVTIIASAKLFIDILNGKRDAITAYSTGELQVIGDTSTAQNLLFYFE
ncbi:MAG: neutral/alkaline non-lysosomal ceramidase N-terminal domain-containing protein [Fimbriimonadia bacterium]|nr:neutral/alkaline non-lysosomal ceramidase N-terminal domain-containing protein [Fimbriimonadia bacterium]